MLAMNTQSIYRIGIVLYALVIGFFGVNHFLHSTGFQNTIPAIIPYHIFWVYLTGAALIAGSVPARRRAAIPIAARTPDIHTPHGSWRAASGAGA